MRKILFSLCGILFLISFFNQQTAHSWGFHAHKKINRMAVFTLPPEMVGFYKKHIDYISEHAVSPDKRRGIIPEEAPRHYIDLEHYGNSPFDSIPKKWNLAVQKYTEETLMEYGIVPWYIEKMRYNLQLAFLEEDFERILNYSADLGHYVADAHVPLHTTENYNGQLTNQKGIHGFWESRIPELLAENYDYWTGKAKYLDTPLDNIWEAIKESHNAVDSVLSFEAELNEKYAPDKKYSFENRGSNTVKVYSVDYTNDYNAMLNGMVERRMLKSIIMVGDLWYTAWLNAGKPDLNLLKEKTISDSLKQVNQIESEKWNSRKVVELKGH